ncbi:1,2-phenylacetyl-CoA epoxidase subunit PaaC [Nocardioides solisilvae]|uniref:1,2-phenylacetyl-CoA epoxidase subunit PaaC n=1 Tax=Nocardioides solisilvae TaxID=1542435 RepID=UPI001EF5655D|nr:1,2-phenylacetyl-CoA epoxidase subunit PaaC [Nocardioides solisilvae]
MTTTLVPGSARALLALGDDALLASQRLGWWISRAPVLEEDVALANIGLDLLGQARGLLARAGELEGRGRDEDALAFWRDAPDFRHVCLVERDQRDFGTTMVRLLLLATWQRELYARLAASSEPGLAAVAGKAVKEVAYHVDHARAWVLRLGDGTEESHLRVQRALDAEWPWVSELFDGSWLDPEVVAAGVLPWPDELRPTVLGEVAAVLARATLRLPDGLADGLAPEPGGRLRGRHGEHTDELPGLLARMQQVARAHPGATW